MTGNALLNAAYKTLGVLGAGQTMSSEEGADGLLRLNDFLDGLATQKLTVYYLARALKTLTANVASYTIGVGGDINQARPLWIPYAGLIINTGAAIATEVPIAVFSDQQWAGIPQKSLASGLSQGIYYDHNWSAGFGRIYPWPVPSVGTTQVVLYTPTALTQFANLSTDYTFPPGYRRMLRYNLAVELAPEFRATVSPQLLKLATDSMADIKRANTRLDELVVDAALITPSGGVYDYRSDNFR